MKRIESAIQRAYCAWVKETYPDIKLATSQNENSYHAKDLGMDVGEPDIRLAKRRNNITHDFYLELKKKKGKLSEDQKTWNTRFDKEFKSDNCTRDVAYGFLEAKAKTACWYVGLFTTSISQ